MRTVSIVVRAHSNGDLVGQRIKVGEHFEAARKGVVQSFIARGPILKVQRQVGRKHGEKVRYVFDVDHKDDF